MAIKTHSLVAIIIAQFALAYSLNAQDTNTDVTPIEPHHYTGSPEGSPRDKLINGLIQEDRTRPIEDLPVTYMVNPEDSNFRVDPKDYKKLRPAYVRYQSGYSSECIYYVWKRVKLDRKEIPVVDAGFHNLSVTDVSQFPKTRIYEVTPPLFYYKLPEGDKYAAGYFDLHERIYYEWRGVQLSKSQIPSDAIPSKLIYAFPAARYPTPAFVAIVPIDPPNE